MRTILESFFSRPLRSMFPFPVCAYDFFFWFSQSVLNNRHCFLLAIPNFRTTAFFRHVFLIDYCVWWRLIDALVLCALD